MDPPRRWSNADHHAGDGFVYVTTQVTLSEYVAVLPADTAYMARIYVRRDCTNMYNVDFWLRRSAD